METATSGEGRTGSGGHAGAPSRPTLPARDVAIVGMACVVPGAPDAETFWANVVDGVDSVAEVPRSRWDPDLFYADPDDPGPGPGPGPGSEPREPMSVSKWGGWIPDVGFDALAWGIPPASLASIDPAQLLALKVAAAALDDAGYAGHDSFDRDRASLVFATGSGGAIELTAGIALRVQLRTHRAGPLPPEVDAHLPQLTPDGLPGVLTSVIAGRVANRLDLGGKNLTVDSACASVLVGLDIACGELASGSSDLVLCGGVDLHNSAQDYLSFTAAGALSPRGRCRAFDAGADGMTLAEGAGCLVLKRLADAERDGDRIYAVVRGVAGSSDGRHLGLTAPRREGQVKAVRRAYQAAGISPAEVGLVEAHGTGTATGDRTELETMTDVFTEAGTGPGSVVLGAVKSNIGHIKCASGIASLIKAARSAYHGVLPPTLHIEQPNEVWDPETSPFVFLDRARPWLDDRRVVGVSGFGFGGTNFHAILENHRASDRSSRPAGQDDHPPPPSGRPHWPAELFAFRARTPAELDARLDRLEARLAGEQQQEPRQADRWRLRDIAAAESGAGEGPVQLAVVATDLDDLLARLRQARLPAGGGPAGGAPSGVYRRDPELVAEIARAAGDRAPQLALVLPGPAEPDEVRPGMGADLLVAWPRHRHAARAADPEVTAALWPPQAFGAAHEPQRATLAGVAGPAAALVARSLTEVLASLGVDADVRELALPRSGDAGADAEHAQAAAQAQLRDLAEAGVRIFVDVGPGQHLSRLAGAALAGRPHLAVGIQGPDRTGHHELVDLLHLLAQLAVADVPVDLDALHTGRGSDPERWREPGPAPAWVVNGHCARTAAGEPLPKGLRPTDQAPTLALAAPGTGPDDPATNGSPTNGSGSDAAGSDGALHRDTAVVLEYLRLVNGIIATNSDLIRSQAGQDR